MYAAGSLTSDSYVWSPGAPGWARAIEVPALAGLFVEPPPLPAG
jgi:hypothetical protein